VLDTERLHHATSGEAERTDRPEHHANRVMRRRAGRS